MVSASDDLPTVRQGLALGAQGFISKSADASKIARDVQSVPQGECIAPEGFYRGAVQESDRAVLDVAQRMAQLTAQQFRVFGMLCMGKLNKPRLRIADHRGDRQGAHDSDLAQTRGCQSHSGGADGRSSTYIWQIRPPPEEPGEFRQLKCAPAAA